MQLTEALDYLNKQLSIACKGNSVSSPGEDNDRVDEISESVRGSRVHVLPDNSSQISAQGYSALERMEQIKGGHVTIELAGNEQPEAARVIDNIVTPLLNRLHITDKRAHRAVAPGDGTGRNIPFFVPTDRAGDFVAQVVDIANKIKASPALRAQLRTGLDVSLQSLNEIAGVKPHVMLDLGQGAQMEGDKIVVKPPHFTLHMQNMPATLARELAELTGQDFDLLMRSGATTSRDHTKRFEGTGKNIDIAMDHPNINQVLAKIKNYARAIKRVGNPGSEHGRSGPG